jgi:hypothetical protein
MNRAAAIQQAREVADKIINEKKIDECVPIARASTEVINLAEQFLYLDEYIKTQNEGGTANE